jgi:NADH-quinone oxidoreductase subunit E
MKPSAPLQPASAAAPSSLDVVIPPELEREFDELITHYPQKRSASLMLLHGLQEHFGYLTKPLIEWTATKLDLEPINIYELVTFYPMFRQEPIGKYQLKICRTLSCALAGSYRIHRQFCEQLGLDHHLHGPQSTPDGKFTVEFVECLAACGTAPVLMCNDALHERVTDKSAAELLKGCS